MASDYPLRRCFPGFRARGEPGYQRNVPTLKPRSCRARCLEAQLATEGSSGDRCYVRSNEIARVTPPGQAQPLEGVVVVLPSIRCRPKSRRDQPGGRPTDSQGSQQLRLGNCPSSVCWDRAHRGHSKRIDGPRRRAGRPRGLGRERRWRVHPPTSGNLQQLRQLRRRALFHGTRELPSRPSSDGLAPQGGRQSRT